MDPRLARCCAEPRVDAADGPDGDRGSAGEPVPQYRVDLERIRFSPYLSRLAAVTQVISQNASGGVVHNRLTHSIKVASVARAIAVAVRADPDDRTVLDELGGCDPVVAQAAAMAHDLGHPPFGHLGERILDRAARGRFGLADGFEGNAQTFRILTRLDVSGVRMTAHPDPARGGDRSAGGPSGQQLQDPDGPAPRPREALANPGLNLTAAVRAAVLKYPWARQHHPTPHPSTAAAAPRGGGQGDEGPGSGKFSAYVPDIAEMVAARSAYPRIGAWRQTIECSAMDIADDIAYSLHDLDDFHRSGVLQHAAVAAEFRTWVRRRAEFAAAGTRQDDPVDGRRPGESLERLRRRLAARDGWIFDDEAFGVAVGRVATDLVDGLLAVPFDSSIAAERALRTFTGSWIDHLRESVEVDPDPPVRSAHLTLGRQAWHEVAVLKFVHQRFVLDRPDLAMFQRGQAEALTSLVVNLERWLTDPIDAGRAPRRLVDLVGLATDDYRRVAREQPELLRGPTGESTTGRDDLIRLGRGRGIIDYVASLTDDQAATAARSLAGLPGQLWSGGSVL